MANESANEGAPSIGIIQPPPDIRNIVDKTAQFVARNGAAFEQRILNNEKNTTKFGFLQGDNPYHAYYQHKLAEFRAQITGAAPPPSLAQPGTDAPPESAQPEAMETDAKPDAPKKKSYARKVELRKKRPLVQPPPDNHTVSIPPGDIIKWTAQCVARNGRAFLSGLLTREARNQQFDFLKGHHLLFGYFTSLVDSYSKARMCINAPNIGQVLAPPPKALETLKTNVDNKFDLLERAFQKLDWDAHVETQRKMRVEEEDAERMAYASIDWHDFKVVETIEFAPEEVPAVLQWHVTVSQDADLPPPLTNFELLNISKQPKPSQQLAEQRAAPPPPAPAGQDMDMDMDMDMEEAAPVVAAKPAAPMFHDEDVKVYKNYQRPTGQTQAASRNLQYQICPRCGDSVPVDEMAEHIRIELLDPRWREHKAADKSLKVDSSLAADNEIGRNLATLSKRRRDIFGDEAEGVLADPTKTYHAQNRAALWDGHKASADLVRSVAQQQSMQAPPPPAAAPPMPPPAQPPRPPPPAPPAAPPAAPAAPPAAPPAPRPAAPPAAPLGAPPPPMGMPGMPPPGMMRPPFPGMPGMPPPPGMMPPPGMPGMPPPPGMGWRPGMPPPPPGMMPRPPMPGMPGEPDSKRSRVEEMMGAEPEALFAARYTEPISVSVTVPKEEGSQWKFEGQTISLTLPVMATVQQVKEAISKQLGMPPNKQKLQHPGHGFLKDQSTLAALNYTGEMLTLGAKERAGRKK